MKSLFDCFGETRIINLEKRADRREQVQHELKLLGAEIGPKIRFFKAICPADANGFPSVGAHGCFMSHLGVLREALENNSSSVLVLEDDVAVSRHLIKNKELLCDKLEELGDDWDILYVGHPLPIKKPGITFEQSNETFQLAHCLAFNGRIIPQVVAHLESILEREPGHPDGGPMHVDGALSRFRTQNPDLKSYISVPSLAFQRPSFSNIAGGDEMNENALIKLMRKVKLELFRFK